MAMLVFVDGRASFVKRIPNGDRIPGVAALGHENRKGGGELNDFGEAFKGVGYLWTREFCEMDIDGDGQTNGQELGDPCCSWTETNNLAYIKGISDPTDKKKMVKKAMFEHIQCTKSEEALEQAEEEAQKNKPKKPTRKPHVTNASATDNADDGSGSETEQDNLRGPDEVDSLSSTSMSIHRDTFLRSAWLAGVSLAVAWASDIVPMVL